MNLKRGVNLSHWLMFRDFDFITSDDMRMIKNAGLDHVRLPFSPEKLFDGGGGWHSAYRAMLDSAVGDAFDAGLNVILDPHPLEHFQRHLPHDIEMLWQKLASHYSAIDPNRLYFETMNEPVFLAQWQHVQARLIIALRKGAPHHTIIVKGGGWENISDLTRLRPYHAPNLIYNFHFYEPHTFTHQGTAWGWHTWPHLHDIPYPSAPLDLSRQTSPQARREAAHYSRSHWNRTRIEKLIGRAAKWARRHGNLTLLCNEFGAYRPTIAPHHRHAYLHDVRIALESHGIGWTMWDYNAGFDLVDENRVISEPMVQALGLH